jgi:glycosyltransferase involved in cell wall biosynthesis/tRNA A-37 threonylcarbamoyl transferase component Bud32
MVQVLHVIDGTTPADMLWQMELLAGPEDAVASLGQPPSARLAWRCRHVVNQPFGSTWLAGLALGGAAGEADVLHAWSLRACQAARVAGWLRGRKVLLSLSYAPSGEPMGWIARMIRKGVLEVTVPTEAARQRMLTCGLPERSVHVLPPAARGLEDAAARRQRARRQLGLDTGEFVIVAPSEMTRAAGHRMASWAQAILRRIESGVFLLMPGGGRDERGVRSFVGTTGYAGEVFFTGERMEAADALAAADVAVFFHERDCGVGALAAAMAAGLPVAAARTADLIECVPDGEAGLLMAPGDPRGASAAIWRIMKDEGLRRRLGGAAARRAGQMFDPATARGKLQGIYAALGKAKGPGLALAEWWGRWRGGGGGGTAGPGQAGEAVQAGEAAAAGAPAAWPAKSPGQMLFADAEAEELLGDRLGELCRPDPPEWEAVKTNPSRTVYRGRVKGQWVYLKHFHRHDWIARLARRLGFSRAREEMRLSQYLVGHGVPVAEVLAARCGQPLEWVATRAIPQAEQADEWHLKQFSRGREGQQAVRGALVVLAEMIGRMHAAGVLHGDLHCGNVLVRTRTAGPKLVLMDLHRARRRGWLSRTARAVNLAQLFHDRRELTSRTERLRFLKHYLRASGAKGTLRGWSIIIEAIGRRHTRRQHAKRDDRVVGTGKYFARLSLGGGWRGHVVLASKWKMPGSRAAKLTFTAEGWRKALGDLESLLAGEDVTVVKDTPSGLIARRRVQVDGHWLEVYVKRARRKQPWKILPDCFRPARALRAFRLGHQLLTRRIVTALPLAAMERRVGPLLLDSILVTEAVDAPDLRTFLSSYLSGLAAGVPWRPPGAGEGPLLLARQRELARQVLRQLGRLLQRLHQNHFTHRDLKSSNLLARWLDEEGMQVVLLDLDGLRLRRVVTARRRFKDLMRLNVALLECPVVNRAGRLRMLTGYLRGSVARGIAFKPYWRTLEDMSAEKRRRQIRSRRERQKAVRRPST